MKRKNYASLSIEEMFDRYKNMNPREIFRRISEDSSISTEKKKFLLKELLTKAIRSGHLHIAINVLNFLGSNDEFLKNIKDIPVNANKNQRKKINQENTSRINSFATEIAELLIKKYC